MVRTLEQAIAQISRLPDADQEQIGRKLLAHVEKLRAIRTEIDKGISLWTQARAAPWIWKISFAIRIRGAAKRKLAIP
jgi:hypothetical protein